MGQINQDNIITRPVMLFSGQQGSQWTFYETLFRPKDLETLFPNGTGTFPDYGDSKVQWEGFPVSGRDMIPAGKEFPIRSNPSEIWTLDRDVYLWKAEIAMIVPTGASYPFDGNLIQHRTLTYMETIQESETIPHYSAEGYNYHVEENV